MLAQLRSLWSGIRRRDRVEGGMDEELRFHVEEYEAELVRSGVAPAEAKRLSRMRFGSLEAAKEQCREARGLRWPDELQRNVRFAVRVLRKSPGFTAVTMITLALCIGANTAVYSVVDAVLFRPIPYAEPERLAQVVTRVHAPGMDGVNEWPGRSRVGSIEARCAPSRLRRNRVFPLV